MKESELTLPALHDFRPFHLTEESEKKYTDLSQHARSLATSGGHRNYFIGVDGNLHNHSQLPFLKNKTSPNGMYCQH